jgi:hypothetical protein
MSLPLLRKELREHGWVLVAAGAIAALALAALLRTAADTGGRFTGFARFLLTIAPLLALVLANRLLVREYAGRTQMFLETLPLGRGRAFATKWLLGCGLMLLAAAVAWVATLWFAQRREVLAASDAVGALASAATVSVTLWSFASLAGMLGRYRYLAWGALAAVVAVAVNVTGVPWLDLPVLRLLGQDVQMATGVPEPSAFVQALTIAAACAAGAAALALVGSGAMASTLAQRMTARERAFVLVALIGVLTVSYTLEPKPIRPPFEITQGERVDGRFARVGVLSTPAFDSGPAQRLARTIADDVDAFVAALDLRVRNSIFVLPQQGLDRHVMQRAALGAEDGIVLKVAPDAPLPNVRMLVLHSLLGDATLGRGLKEDRHALLDGLSAYWVLRDDDVERERWWLRAAAVEEPLPAGYLTAWAQTSERFGECQSLALAFGAFDTLVERLGRDAALATMREIFSAPNDDMRALFERRPAAILATAGVDWTWLERAAAEGRERARERHAAALAQRPARTASVDWRSETGRGISIETTVTGAARHAAYYATLYPWTADVGEMPRFDVLGSSGVLPFSPSQSARVLTVIEVDDDVLDCPVRLLAERLEFR